MNKLEMPLELALRKESTQRLLQGLYGGRDWDGLFGAAEIWNDARHLQ